MAPHIRFNHDEADCEGKGNINTSFNKMIIRDPRRLMPLPGAYNRVAHQTESLRNHVGTGSMSFFCENLGLVQVKL